MFCVDSGGGEREEKDKTRKEKKKRKRKKKRKKMSHAMRKAVSRDKRRLKVGEYDLDLTYITKRVIAMGFPAGKRNFFCWNFWCLLLGGFFLYFFLLFSFFSKSEEFFFQKSS